MKIILGESMDSPGGERGSTLQKGKNIGVYTKETLVGGVAGANKDLCKTEPREPRVKTL